MAIMLALVVAGAGSARAGTNAELSPRSRSAPTAATAAAVAAAKPSGKRDGRSRPPRRARSKARREPAPRRPLDAESRSSESLDEERLLASPVQMSPPQVAAPAAALATLPSASSNAEMLRLRRDPEPPRTVPPRISELRTSGAHAAAYTGAVLLLASGLLTVMQLRAEMGFAEAGASQETAEQYATGARVALIAGGACLAGALVLAAPLLRRSE